MKTIHLHFKKTGRWLWLIVWGLLLTGQVQAQKIYTTGLNRGSGFVSYDLNSDTWTKLAPQANTYWDCVFHQGKLYGITTGIAYVYDIANNSWSTVSNSAFRASDYLTSDGKYIYINHTSTDFKRWDPVTNTATSLAVRPVADGYADIAYDGVDYIYATGNKLLRYSISQDTWTVLATPPFNPQGIAIKNGKIYLSGYGSYRFAVYDVATDSYTTLTNTPFMNMLTVENGDGNLIYLTDPYGNWSKYDVSTGVWTTMPSNADRGFVYLGATCSPMATATATQATCASGGGVNANAALTLSSYGGGVTKVGYSAGSSYAGPDFSTATAVTAAPMTLVNSLTNPTVDQPYTIRIFKDATCYLDVISVLKPQVCLTSDVSVSVSPLSQTAASGEMQKYTVTVTNAGPDPSDVKLRVPIPTNRTLLGASPQQGTYTESTQIWDVGNLSVGSKTLILTIKVN